MTTLRITQDARQDLSKIRIYTHHEYGARQAMIYLDHLKQGFKTLRAHPDIGFSIDHLKPGYRGFRVQRHCIFYTLIDDVIAVVAILHESQLPRRQLDQRDRGQLLALIGHSICLN